MLSIIMVEKEITWNLAAAIRGDYKILVIFESLLYLMLKGAKRPILRRSKTHLE